MLWGSECWFPCVVYSQLITWINVEGGYDCSTQTKCLSLDTEEEEKIPNLWGVEEASLGSQNRQEDRIGGQTPLKHAEYLWLYICPKLKYQNTREWRKWDFPQRSIGVILFSVLANGFKILKDGWISNV